WISLPEWRLPCNLTLVQINRRQHRPRWRDKRQASRQHRRVAATREHVRILDRYERIRSIVLGQPVYADLVRRAHKQISGLRIKCRASPIGAAVLRWALQRSL